MSYAALYRAAAVALYRAAAAYIGEYGLAQGHYRTSHSGAACTLGALAEVAGYTPELFVAEEELVRGVVDVIPAHQLPDSAAEGPWPHPYGLVIAWNDADGRTAEEVIAVLEAAAVLADTEIPDGVDAELEADL